METGWRKICAAGNKESCFSPFVRMPEKYSDLLKKSVDFAPLLW